MDSRLNKPLEAERAELARVLQSAKPRAVAALEAQLTAARDKRAVMATKFQSLCRMEHYAAAQKPAVEITALEQELATIDQVIRRLRTHLETARAIWTPTFFAATKPALDATAPALQQAIALVEAASLLFGEHDKFVTANGLGTWRAGQARRLNEIAQSLRRFCKGRQT